MRLQEEASEQQEVQQLQATEANLQQEVQQLQVREVTLGQAVQQLQATEANLQQEVQQLQVREVTLGHARQLLQEQEDHLLGRVMVLLEQETSLLERNQNLLSQEGRLLEHSELQAVLLQDRMKLIQEEEQAVHSQQYELPIELPIGAMDRPAEQEMQEQPELPLQQMMPAGEVSRRLIPLFPTYALFSAVAGEVDHGELKPVTRVLNILGVCRLNTVKG